jgi:hypothetical protein
MKAALEASIQRQSGWLIPAGGGLTARNVRFFESPFPIVVHVISSLTYFILGAFRGCHRGFHLHGIRENSGAQRCGP